MNDNSGAFDLFISELLDEKLKTLSESDGHYASLKAKAAFESDLMESDFTRQGIELIECFYDLICEIDAIENRFLYRQGYLDCVKVLKTLGVLA